MIIYLGLGSNEGDREQNLQKAIKKLRQSKEINVTKLSSIFESEPIGYINQSWFLNAVIEVESNFKPYDLLQFIKDIEEELGRRKTFRWGPRIIDIDIISYGNYVLKSSRLTIPHPQMHFRKFVLIPLFEIAPYYIHPVSKLSVWQMIQQSPDNKVYLYKTFND